MKVDLWYAQFRNYVATKSNIAKICGPILTKNMYTHLKYVYTLKICMHTQNMYTHSKYVYTLQICIHTSNMYTHIKHSWLLNIIRQKSVDLR